MYRNQHKSLVHFLFILVAVFVLLNGIAGADFGRHWDENSLMRNLIRSINQGIVLPGWYYYPSFIYDVAIISLLPDVLRAKMSGGGGEDLVRVVKSHRFKLRIRTIFILITYLSLLWIYLLVLKWRGSWHEALLASSLAGLSWELAYHARWIAPDALMMQFGVLTIMCLVFALNSCHEKRWLIAASLAAGLACGTKYPGGLLLVPVLLVTYESFRKRSRGGFPISELSIIVLVFIATYLFTTPGTLLEQETFFRHVRFEICHYGGGHGGYTVVPGAQHALRVLTYFCMAVFSKYSAIACFFFALAIVGVATLVREERTMALVFLSFPLSYIIFMSCQKVMIVRNYLVIIPFLSILAARGCVFLYYKIRYPTWKALFSISVIILLLVNSVWLIRATQSIRMRNKIDYVERLARYIDQRQSTLFLLSETVANELSSYNGKARLNVTRRIEDNAQAAVLYSSDCKIRGLWTANRFDYTHRSFGPLEVNFNYYPTWVGDRRIVIMPVESALPLGIFKRK